MPGAAALIASVRRLATPDLPRFLVRKISETPLSEYRAWVRTLPIEPDDVLYESFAGNGMLDSPEALFRALLADPEQQHRKHVWVLDEPRRHRGTTDEFSADRRVRFVRRGSRAYHRALATAGLLINNATFPAEFGKRPGQTYLNTWHGTPLKRMGYDERQGASGAGNVLRNFMMADYLLSSSSFMSRTMYEQAYRLANVAPGKIIEGGFPRTDRQVLDEAGRGEVTRRLQARGVSVEPGERVVLYAPTWKGESFHRPLDETRELADRVRRLTAHLPAGHRVLLKVHQQVSDLAATQPSLLGLLVPNDVPTNEVLAITDVLVTDYSSIFFDFLATGRPIVFFTPDAARYDDHRGLYLDQKELPGPQVVDVEDLSVVINAVGTGQLPDPQVSHLGAYAAARSRFAAHEDGAVTQRVLDVVVRGRSDSVEVRAIAGDGRPTMLIYLGGMMSNGITTSALNLLRNLDHEAFDVSVVYDASIVPERVANAALIDSRVRQFVRTSGFNPAKVNWLTRRRLFAGEADRIRPSHRLAFEGLLASEWQRTVGAAHFDQVIDFSGYSPLWANLVVGAPAGSRAIWLHNDLLADQLREVGGRHPHRRNLAGVFATYRRFDRLVSVSAALRDINARHLGQWAPAECFVAARNTVDADRVLTSAAAPLPDEPARLRRMLPTAPPDGRHERRGEGEQHGCAHGFTFVSVGRLSPEKNHARLIDAFAPVHAEHPETQLVIIGDGPLRDALQHQIAERGLGESVLLAGMVSNPWSIMARCDCFVLSSDYEGQPMVILEARTLGLPVLTTAFESVSSAVSPQDGLIVSRSVAALADGLRAALAGQVPTPPFDANRYNAETIEELVEALGSRV
ncbi:hypothetical protein BA895_09445 [Humibacillus sp. DSM 29435]|uniref:glycosyltransferase n=1 Tax=Humibacillus sp. DSM 29435 TaxID=1869167 RepID=UPI00087270E9|nr:glycosyltransferase [Humibacillus sp. DSM 29435]OFE14573.1 hypothetical protein BA895_09445 [Humibacillus sp. DSM 29435]